MSKESTTICVFGSSLVQPGSVEYEEGRRTGALLAAQGLTVCTGGYDGVMEAVSRGAKEAGGRTVGVTSHIFHHRVGNPFLDEEIHTDTLVDRLQTMMEVGCGYLALQGGIGTLTEISLLWSLLQIHSLPPRPFVLLQNPWADLLQFCSTRLIMRPQDLEHLQLAPDVDSAVQALLREMRGAQG